MKYTHAGRYNRLARKSVKMRERMAKSLWPRLFSQCAGRCCAAFVLNAGRIKHGDTFWGTEDQATLQQLFYPITREEAAARTGIPDVSDKDWWACRAWDQGTGLCKAREGRPRLCRDYACSQCDICRVLTAPFDDAPQVEDLTKEEPKWAEVAE